MSFDPTPEQANARDLFLTGDSLAITAGAGAGKTSTLKILADAVPEKRVQFTAFNKAIVVDAGKRFPENTSCNTAHSLAMSWLRGLGPDGRAIRDRLDSSARMRSDQIARQLGIDPLVVEVEGERKRLAPGFLAGHVMAAVTGFCQSADVAPGLDHFGYIDGIDMPAEGGRRTYRNNDLVREHLLPVVEKAWADLMSPRGRLPFRHDHYLKAWQLSGPKIHADVILVDEAQDLNPVLAAIVAAQDHAQLVYVGDENQQLYAWTGAVNALAHVPVELRCSLTQSFRFGPAVAEVANRVLAQLGSSLRIQGFDPIDSRVAPVSDPRVVLTRTNAAAVKVALAALQEGKTAHLVGGGGDVESFAKAAQQLQEKGETWHRELACFSSWGQVQDYVEQDPQGSELKLLVGLIDTYGADVIVDALGRMTREDRAQLTISTAHRSKGREWPSVQLADDFPTPEEGPLADPELMLLYVAATRARLQLDITKVPALTAPVPVASASASGWFSTATGEPTEHPY